MKIPAEFFTPKHGLATSQGYRILEDPDPSLLRRLQKHPRVEHFPGRLPGYLDDSSELFTRLREDWNYGTHSVYNTLVIKPLEDKIRSDFPDAEMWLLRGVSVSLKGSLPTFRGFVPSVEKLIQQGAEKGRLDKTLVTVFTPKHDIWNEMGDKTAQSVLDSRRVRGRLKFLPWLTSRIFPAILVYDPGEFEEEADKYGVRFVGNDRSNAIKKAYILPFPHYMTHNKLPSA